MRYTCIACDHEFEIKEGAKPRCPKCLGIHDLEPVSGGGGPKQPVKRQWIAPVVVLAIAALVAVIYFLTGKTQEPISEVKQHGLSSALEEFGVPEDKLAEPFAITERIEKFAEKVVSNKSGIQAMQAIFDALSKMRGDGKWKPHHQREPRAEKPLAADRLLARLEKGGEPFEALSYELACLFLASARSLELNAKMAEIYSFKNEKKPADPGGKIGRYGVVLDEGTKEKAPPLFDPYGGRAGASAEAEVNVLSDVQAVAPYYGLSSLSLLIERNTSEALKLNEIAVKLAPKSPYFRTGRGLIFAASAAPTEALAELEKASKLRLDAVNRTNLAEVLLLADPSGKRSEAELQAALSSMPDYARAHALLAMVHMMQRRLEQAEQELALAERLDPSSPVVAMFWAQFYAAQAQTDQAIAKARDAVRLSEESISSLLGLAGIYRATARFDEMRATLDRALEIAKSPEIAQQIKELFGYNPAQQDSGDAAVESAESEKDSDDGSRELKIELGSERAPIGGGKLKLGEGLDKGFGSGLDKGLGGENLKLDLNLKQR
ncbi:MAG: tetratricopeptide repeat protein [Proteobacteria bacterium]|nr:tetratricopeptide repeat protein [Pseudomonadota bacterium]